MQLELSGIQIGDPIKMRICFDQVTEQSGNHKEVSSLIRSPKKELTSMLMELKLIKDDKRSPSYNQKQKR